MHSLTPSHPPPIAVTSTYTTYETSTHDTHTHTGPAHHRWGAPDELEAALDATKRNKTKEGGVLSAERREEDWCVLHCGWRALAEERDDFPLLYVLGLYLTWSSGSVLEQLL